MPNNLTYELEEPRLIKRSLRKLVRRHLADAAAEPDIDAAAVRLRSDFPTWFVYKGGSHVALHVLESEPRLAIVKELRPAH